MTTTARLPRTARPILHVHVVDDLTGDLLADVDAASTADGLAYYLRSRGIVPDATEETILYGVNTFDHDVTDAETIVYERRGIGTGNLELALFAKIEGARR